VTQVGGSDSPPGTFYIYERIVKVSFCFFTPRERASQYNSLASARENLSDIYIHNPFLKQLMKFYSIQDPDTFMHSVLVAHTVMEIGKTLGYDDFALTRLGVGGLLHDIGKLGIADSIDKSTEIVHYHDPQPQFEVNGDRIDTRPPEIKAMHMDHPVIGGWLIKKIFSDKMPNSDLKYYCSFAFTHHEFSDIHHSYPRSSRQPPNLDMILLHLADSICAMREPRDYKKGKQTPIKRIIDLLDQEILYVFDRLRFYSLTLDQTKKEGADALAALLEKNLNYFSSKIQIYLICMACLRRILSRDRL
jgi:hypothetical protein